MADISLVLPEQAHLVWPIVSQWVRDSIEKVDLSRFDDVEREVLSGEALLWAIHNGTIHGVAITQITLVEGGKVCTVISCGGSDVLGSVDRLIAKVEEYAKQEGCRSVLVWGRKGWARALKDYRQSAVVLRKELFE